jgi:hypothetical protein
MVREGKPHRERAMDGKFRCAASPDERTTPHGFQWQISCQVRSSHQKKGGLKAAGFGIPLLPGAPMLVGLGREWVWQNPMSASYAGTRTGGEVRLAEIFLFFRSGSHYWRAWRG